MLVLYTDLLYSYCMMFLCLRSNLIDSYLLICLQAIHAFDAVAEKELSLAVGDFVVVRKVCFCYLKLSLLIMVFTHTCIYSMTLFVSFLVAPTLFMWSRI